LHSFSECNDLGKRNHQFPSPYLYNTGVEKRTGKPKDTSSRFKQNMKEENILQTSEQREQSSLLELPSRERSSYIFLSQK
jgi:hypothetical protein